MELALLDNKNMLTVSDDVFNVDFKEALIHQVVTTYLSNGRLGTKAQKNRSDVRGGGRKPWRQKGTGRARAGTIRSPLFRGGGVTFAARPKVYNNKVNKKVYRLAVCSILSELIRQTRLIVLEKFELKGHKTKDFLKKLDILDNYKNALIIVDELQDNLILASRNLPLVEVVQANEINPVKLVAADKVLITQAALKKIEENLI